MKSKREYIIPFVGLKLGFHEYEFSVRDAFFDELEYSIIEKGDLQVSLRLEKKETMLIGEFKINGVVSTLCDRCNDPIFVPLKGEFRLIYKFGNEVSDNETLIVLPNEAYELDVRQNIYELITVSLPSRRIHRSGECNEDMIELLQKYASHAEDHPENSSNEKSDNNDENQPIDPRWAALKNLN